MLGNCQSDDGRSRNAEVLVIPLGIRFVVPKYLHDRLVPSFFTPLQQFLQLRFHLLEKVLTALFLTLDRRPATKPARTLVDCFRNERI